MVGARGFEPLSPCGQRLLRPPCIASSTTPPTKDTCVGSRKKPCCVTLFHARRVVNPADPGSSGWRVRKSERRQESCGRCTLAIETGNNRRVVHPTDQSN